jgi:hypothetical protein
VGSEIRAGTNRLLAANKLDDVVALVAECEKMDPSLDTRYMSVLRTLRDDAQQRIAARQRGPAGAGPRSARLAPASAPATVSEFIPS